jgi:MFS family permease
MLERSTTSEKYVTIYGRRLPRHLLTSLAAVIVGSLVLRVAAQTMSQMLQFYFARINSEYRPLSHETTALITASFFITELLGSPVLGAMSDRLGRKRFIILGPVFGALAVQIPAVTFALPLLVVSRLLAGLSTASSIPATLGYISEATTRRPRLRARIMGLFEVTFVGGVAAGAVLGGYLWKFFATPVHFGAFNIVSPAFSVNGLVYLVSLAIFAWGLREYGEFSSQALVTDDMLIAGAGENHTKAGLSLSKELGGKLSHYVRILSSPMVWDFVPAWLSVNCILGMWINLTPRLLIGKDHFPNQTLVGAFTPVRFGNGFAAYALIFAVGVLVWSLFIGRYRKTSTMLIAVAGLFVTLMMTYLLNHSAGFSTHMVYSLTACLLAGFITLSGFTPAALTYLADITERYVEDRGSIMGLYTVFLGIGQVVGTAVGGEFADRGGIDGLILLSAAFGVITLASLLYLRKCEESSPPPERARPAVKQFRSSI